MNYNGPLPSSPTKMLTATPTVLSAFLLSSTMWAYVHEMVARHVMWPRLRHGSREPGEIGDSPNLKHPDAPDVAHAVRFGWSRSS